MRELALEHVRAALSLPKFDAVDAQRHMAPRPRSMRRSPARSDSARQAAVLVLLYPGDAGLSLILVQRTEHEADVHSGQIGLPGGAQEPGETVEQTALREANEEVGVAASDVEIIGQLAMLYIPPSDFEVHPIIGYIAVRPVWRPDPQEVAALVECPLYWLLDDARKVEEDWDLHGLKLRVPWYAVRGHRVWGATAIILGELEQRLWQVVG